MYEKLNNDNFLIYAAKHYDNPQCHSTEEFIDEKSMMLAKFFLQKREEIMKEEIIEGSTPVEETY
jgi:hypothetical protein